MNKKVNSALYSVFRYIFIRFHLEEHLKTKCRRAERDLCFSFFRFDDATTTTYQHE